MGRRAQVVNYRDQGEKRSKDGKDQQGTAQRPAQVDQHDKGKIDRYQEKGDRLMREAPVQQQMMNMVPVRAERRTAVQDADPEYPQGIQQGDHQYRKSNGGGG